MCMLVMLFCMFLFFFFKQKTAYEMRISDWSSDVCSSDLIRRLPTTTLMKKEAACGRCRSRTRARYCYGRARFGGRLGPLGTWPWRRRRSRGRGVLQHRDDRLSGSDDRSELRSEEHTSELQSLMRISYAVFCLKKKKTHKNINK